MAHIARAASALHAGPGRSPRRRGVVWLRQLLRDQRGSQITDNLGLIVVGIVAVVAIGGLISGLDTTVFNWVSTQLGLG
jgi:hypothetical protein